MCRTFFVIELPIPLLGGGAAGWHGGILRYLLTQAKGTYPYLLRVIAHLKTVPSLGEGCGWF